jgi:hypothetical protein
MRDGARAVNREKARREKALREVDPSASRLEIPHPTGSRLGGRVVKQSAWTP